MKNSFLKCDPGFFLYLACVVLLVPLKLMIAWGLAVTIHELSHMVALKLCHVEVISVRLRASGVLMDTVPMENWKELICAVAGPLGGLSLLLVARWLPCTAIFACVHSLYNLLPIFPLDGGRALRCILITLYGFRLGERLTYGIGSVVFFLVLALMIYLSRIFASPVFAICFMCAVLMCYYQRKFPCKRAQQIVQYDKRTNLERYT